MGQPSARGQAHEFRLPVDDLRWQKLDLGSSASSPETQNEGTPKRDSEIPQHIRVDLGSNHDLTGQNITHFKL